MKKHLLYARYLARHKWFVFVAGLRIKAPLWRLLIHDWSKFLPSEWIPYANFFYGKRYPRIPEPLGPKDYIVPLPAKEAFDRAWLHHQHFNSHHYQHWILREDSGGTKFLEMPEKLVREMVADWMGAGRAITGKWDAAAWYVRNKENIAVHASTRVRVEQLLGLQS